jgi:hypothetical protein
MKAMAEKPVFYSDVLKQHSTLYYESNNPDQIPEYIENAAKRIHSLMIWSASQNAFFQAVMLSSTVTNEEAKYYLQFGATRRLEMIWYAYRNLVSMAPPDRSEPLESEESRQLMTDLNVIYLNLRGVLDNLAWALLSEFVPERLSSLRPMQVGLFLPSVKGEKAFSDLIDLINQHQSWDRDVKERRDPAAHRIPLALPPALLNKEETARYRELESEHQIAMQNSEFALADQILTRQRRLGTFRPWFVHEPALGPIAIYPTLPDDLAHVVQIFDGVRSFFVNAANLA